MPDADLNFFVQLESQVWNALVTGDAQSDARFLADDFLGVYKSGFAGKSEHVGQLSEGPTVAEFSIQDATVRVLCEGLVLLAYRADWIRVSGNQRSSPRSTYITSLWKQAGTSWINIFSQDTDAA